MNLENLKKTAAGLLFLITIFSFNNSEVGGIQLLMSMEQQKKTQRLVNYFEDDLKTFHHSVDTSLYYLNWRNKKKRKKDVTLSKKFKQEVVELAKELNLSLNNLNEAFKSIYFVYGAEDYYKEYFESFKNLKSNLENQNIEIESDYLFDLHNEAEEALSNLSHIQTAVRGARIANNEELKKKAKEMSIWEWLFGY